MTSLSWSMWSAIRAADGRGPGQPLGAVQGQADPEQPPDDMFVQVPGDPVAVGQHLQFASARSGCRRVAGPARPGRRRWPTAPTPPRRTPATSTARTASSTPARSSSAPSGIASAGPNSIPNPAATSNARPVTFRGTWSANTAPVVEPVTGIRRPRISSAFGPTLTATVSSPVWSGRSSCRGRWAARSASSPRRSARPPGRRSTATRCRCRSRTAVAR